MRIAQVIKAKKLTPGVYVLVFDADGKPSSWNRVVSIEPQYEPNWFDVELDGIRDLIDIKGSTRVVVWK